MKRALRWLAVLVVVFAALVVAFRTFKQIRPAVAAPCMPPRATSRPRDGTSRTYLLDHYRLLLRRSRETRAGARFGHYCFSGYAPLVDRHGGRRSEAARARPESRAYAVAHALAPDLKVGPTYTEAPSG
jgi:hypothetical protein